MAASSTRTISGKRPLNQTNPKERDAVVKKATTSSSREPVLTPEEHEAKDIEGLNAEQLLAYNLATKEGANLLITGQGGTGKTHLIKRIVASIQRKFPYGGSKFAVTATTGCAALLIDGTTFHRWTSLGIMAEEAAVLVKKVRQYPRTRAKWFAISVLIIDEISMMRGDLLDKFDQIARAVRNAPTIPFGGIQLILLGDFLQLPPVVKSNEKCINKYAFNAKSWKTGNITTVHLTENHRQKDAVLQQILKEARFGKLSDESEEILKGRVVSNIYQLPPNKQGIKPAILMSRIVSVDAYNRKQLSLIKEPHITFKGRGGVMFPTDECKAELKFLIENCPVDDIITLAVGAQVMLRVNLDLDKKLANGSLGVVTRINEKENQVFVRFFNLGDEEHLITEYLWDRTICTVPFAVYTQFPLSLAWAISIHKSQGQQFAYAAIDMKDLFEYGQGYTALSRVSSLEGLSIANFDRNHFFACPEAIKFYDTIGISSSSSSSSSSGIAEGQEK